MEELTKKSIKKTLRFEKGGEIFTLEIGLENISPDLKKDTAVSFLKVLFDRMIDELFIH